MPPVAATSNLSDIPAGGVIGPVLAAPKNAMIIAPLTVVVTDGAVPLAAVVLLIAPECTTIGFVVLTPAYATIPPAAAWFPDHVHVYEAGSDAVATFQ